MRRAIAQGPGLDGQDIYGLKMWLLEITAAAVTYGLLLCIGIMASYTLIGRGLRKQRTRQALLAIILIILTGATGHLALNLAWMIVQLPTLAAEYVDRTMLLKRLNLAQTWIRRLIYFLSDIIVVWRAWVIWPDNRAVHAALFVCLLATGATSLTLAVFNYNSDFRHIHYQTLEENFLGTFPLLITNLASTTLISYKLWYYRQNIKRFLHRYKTRVESVLVLLMESGWLYLGFWVLLMVGDFGYYGPDFQFEWFQPNISGLYPTVIIFMVSREMMMSEELISADLNLSACLNVLASTEPLAISTRRRSEVQLGVSDAVAVGLNPTASPGKEGVDSRTITKYTTTNGRGDTFY
ncbi:hypothetical protein FB45DRAFT_147776 [Roridomyces roridus]|uniref:Uncharacterized protein n=1 Tax=Roridomyces roridus TaxID=1738132 RepID=A0AAD7BGE1_9AGAR|nr:hypothetical protein FB45DRAFT_147776 [Roridomyces roridus]